MATEQCNTLNASPITTIYVAHRGAPASSSAVIGYFSSHGKASTAAKGCGVWTGDGTGRVYRGFLASVQAMYTRMAPALFSCLSANFSTMSARRSA